MYVMLIIMKQPPNPIADIEILPPALASSLQQFGIWFYLVVDD
jgi:hypothetical protein